MVDVFLFRHSHVDYAPPAEITAHNALTPLGCRLARRLAERCDEWNLEYLFVSTMLRAQQTADAITGRFPALPRWDMPELAEICVDDLADYLGVRPAEDMRQWDDAHYAHANERMWERMVEGWTIIQQVVSERSLERVAIVSHGGALNALLRHFLGGQITRLRTCRFQLDWTSSTCLRYTEEGRWIRWVNDARHVEDLRHLL